MNWTVETTLETARGNDCVVIKSEQGRYKFSKIRELASGEVRYRCTNRKCNVNVFLNQAEGRVSRVSVTRIHSHPPIKASHLSLVRLSSALKRYARENCGQKSVDQLINEAYDIGVFTIPSSKRKLLKRALEVARRHILKGPVPLGNWDPPASSSDQPPLVSSSRPRAINNTRLTEERRTEEEEELEPVDPCQLTSLMGVKTEPDQLTTLMGVKTEPDQLTEETDELTGEPAGIKVKSEPHIKEEPAEDLEPTYPEAETGNNAETQTERDEDLDFLLRVHPLMKKLKASDKSMMKAQIQQLIQWKLKEAV